MQLLQQYDRLPEVDCLPKMDNMSYSTLRREILKIVSKYEVEMTVDQVKILVRDILSGGNDKFADKPIINGYYPIVASTEGTIYKHILKANLLDFSCMFIAFVGHSYKQHTSYKRVMSLLSEYQDKYGLKYDVVGIELPVYRSDCRLRHAIIPYVSRLGGQFKIFRGKIDDKKCSIGQIAG